MADVVVGLDGSPHSRAALRWAAAAATARGSRLRVISAWQYPSDAPMPWQAEALTSPEQMDRSRRDETEQALAEELGPDMPDSDIQIVRGAAVTGLRAAAAAGADLLVVGSRGLGGFDGLLLGSVSRQLADQPPCPLLIVRDATRTVNLANILVATDGSGAANSALRWAGQLAHHSEGKVTAFHSLLVATIAPAATVADELRLSATEVLEGPWTAELRGAGVAYQTLLGNGDPRLTIEDTAEDLDADLIVVGSHGTGGTAPILLGSVANHLIQHSRRPVAVIPASWS